MWFCLLVSVKRPVPTHSWPRLLRHKTLPNDIVLVRLNDAAELRAVRRFSMFRAFYGNSHIVNPLVTSHDGHVFRDVENAFIARPYGPVVVPVLLPRWSDVRVASPADMVGHCGASDIALVT